MFKWLLQSSLANRLLVLIASAVLVFYGAYTLSRTPSGCVPRPQQADRHDHDRGGRHGC
jgi:Cu/Ag efflux pump CusA